MKSVNATNGLLTFEQKVRDFEDTTEDDDQWHDWTSKAPISKVAGKVEVVDTPSTSAPAMAWPAKPGQAHFSQDGIRQIKSKLVNNIFHQEMLYTYEQKSSSRSRIVDDDPVLPVGNSDG